MNLFKILFSSILFLLLLFIFLNINSAQASILETYDLHIQSSYFGVGDASSLNSELGLRTSILHNPSNLGGQITVSLNSLQLGFRQVYRNPEYFYGGPRLFDLFEDNALYIEPTFAHRRYSDFNTNTFGGYLGVIVSETISLDFSLGLEFFSKDVNGETKIQNSLAYRLGLGVSF